MTCQFFIVSLNIDIYAIYKNKRGDVRKHLIPKNETERRDMREHFVPKNDVVQMMTIFAKRQSLY